MMITIKNTKLFTLKTAALILMVTATYNLPHVYYRFIKIAALLLFALIAYVEYNEGLILMALISAGAAIIFFPLSNVYLSRQYWQNVDVTLAVIIGVSILFDFIWYNKAK